MEIVVCIKQVPETFDLEWDPKRGTLLRDGDSGLLNPNDKNALEAALRLKEEHGGTITALSMGPPHAEEALREALSMGIDRAILLCDRAFAGADTWATSYTLSLALKKLAPFDLVLCGKESADGMTGHIGPQLGEFLNLPQLTCATRIDFEGRFVTIEQNLEDGYRVLKSPLPVLITVETGMNQPRIPSMDLILESYQSKKVLCWGSGDLDGLGGRCGLEGSPTRSKRIYTGQIQRGKVQLLGGQPEETAKKFVQILEEKNLI